MIFAQVPAEAIQQLKGLKYHLFTIVILEEFEGGGVCRLTPLELSKKYAPLKNDSNTARLRKQMITDGWFVEVVGGIVTKKFKDTAKNAVKTDAQESELQKLQLERELAAKIAVERENELQKMQSETAKIAGTEVAKKDLYLEDTLEEEISLTAHARDWQYPARELYEAFPELELTPGQVGSIEADVGDAEIDKSVWLATIKLYKQNHNPRLGKYMPDNVGTLLSVFSDRKKKEERNAAKATGNGNGYRGSSDSGAEQRAEQIDAIIADSKRFKRPQLE